MDHWNRFINFLTMLFRNHYMIRSMVARDLGARYVGSLLGFFWSVIHPLSQFLLYYFIFAVVIKIRLGPEYGGTNYAVWLIAGLLPWLFFAEVITRSPNAVVGQSSLINKMVFPSEIMPFVHLVAAMINHFISVGILTGLLIFLDYRISLKILFLLPYLVVISILILGMAWLLSAINVFLRDVGQIVGVVINIWFFLTPILYTQDLIPEILQTLFELNPMLHAVEGYRMALLGKTDFDVVGFSYLVFVGLFIFVLGGLTFKRLKPDFADVL